MRERSGGIRSASTCGSFKAFNMMPLLCTALEILSSRSVRTERRYRTAWFCPVSGSPMVTVGWDVEADNLILMIKDL